METKIFFCILTIFLMSQGCKDHENLCVYDQYTLHVDVDVAPDYSQQKKTRSGIAQDRAASIGRQLAQRRRQELLEHARGGAKYAVRRFPARRERARARACPRAATRTLPARNNAKRGVLFSEIVRERARDANFARTQQCEASRITKIPWKYAGNILDIPQPPTRAWANFARTQQSQTMWL